MTINITAGPSKFDLMLALFDRGGTPRSVEFRLAGPGKHRALVVITAVECEDGSGESWNYKGRLLRIHPSKEGDGSPRLQDAEGWYHSGRRQGTMRISGRP